MQLQLLASCMVMLGTLGAQGALAEQAPHPLPARNLSGAPAAVGTSAVSRPTPLLPLANARSARTTISPRGGNTLLWRESNVSDHRNLATTAANERTTGVDGDTTVVSGVRIAAVLEGGSWIELTDGTRWEVYLPDRPSTDTWRQGDFVSVRMRPIREGDGGRFRFELVNGRERSEAAVRFSGASAP